MPSARHAYRLVAAPCGTSLSVMKRRKSFVSSQLLCRHSGVLITPGCRETLSTFEPASSRRSARPLAKRMLAALLCPYAPQGVYLRSTKLRSADSTEPIVCAVDATVTTRPSSSMSGSSRRVSAKCPRWLVPICSSKPCLVFCCGVAMTPALFSSSETRPSFCAISRQAALTESRSARSSFCTRARPAAAPISASARSPAASSRQASTTKHPTSSSALADSAPMPELPPVTTATPPRAT
mmetsp:Transcript_33225/g.84669  ORF Transcript_33225/g.84669 Transcript_33225/m.84669 type:complete len:239 (+) Transcript_33225:258-974(+)